MEEQKSSHGGKREGAGRKKGSTKAESNATKTKSLSVVGSQTELDRLREMAKEAHKTTSRFIIESLNAGDEQN